MSRVSPKTRTEFLFTLTEHTNIYWRVCERLGTKILRNGTMYKRLQEEYCNGPAGLWRDDYETWDRCLQHKIELVERRVIALCGTINVTPVFSGDPRGCTIKLVLPDGYTDDWGKIGLCVPTS